MALSLQSAARIPEPWIPLAEAAYKIGVGPQWLAKLCARQWEAAGLARRFGNAWAVKPEIDKRLNCTRWQQRDIDQIAELRRTCRPAWIERAEACRKIVEGFDDFESTGRGAIADAKAYCAIVLKSDLAEKAGIRKLSKSTLYAWKSTYYADGIAGLVRSQAARGTVDPIGDAAWDHFLEAKAGRRTVRAAYDLTLALATGEHRDDAEWKWPSYRTVALRYSSQPTAAKVWMNDGERKMRAALPKISRSLEDIPAGAHLVGDCMTFDFMGRVVASNGWRRARLTLTAFMCVRSRLVAGWHIEEFGNSDTILSAHKMACLTTGTLPDEATVDNGRDFRAVAGRTRRDRKWAEFDSKRILSAFERMGIRVHFSIAHSPWGKAIESRFRTIHEGFCKWFPSYWGHKTDAKPWDADKWTRARIDELPTEEEVRDAFGHYLVSLHDQPVIGDGMFNLTPRQALAQFFTTSPRPVTEDYLNLYCSRMHGPVKVGRDGIRHNNIRYGKFDEAVFRMAGQQAYFLADPVTADRINLCDARGLPTGVVAFADRNLGQTQAEVRAAGRETRHYQRIIKSYPKARDYTLKTTGQKIVELRRRAARLKQVPDESLPAPAAPQTLRMVGSEAEQAVAKVKKAVGAAAVRQLHRADAAARAMNEAHDMPVDFAGFAAPVDDGGSDDLGVVDFSKFSNWQEVSGDDDGP